MIHYKNCPACDSANINKILSALDFTVSGKSFQVWQCASCSLRFTQDIPGEAEIAEYYKSSDYISHSETNKGIINWLYLQVRRFTLSSKRKFIQKKTGLQKGSVLDIGAGTGAFLNEMNEAGWITKGLETDDQVITRAAAVYGLQLKPSAQLFELEENSFDVITLWHVLEHVHRLHEYIDQIKKICRPGGKIFIAVPNYTSFDAVKYSSDWAAYDVPRHLYHFSPAAMQALMQQHGCVIEGMQPMWFDSFYVSLLSEKYKSGSSGLIKGFWTGLRSNVKAYSNNRRASSLIYIIKVEGL